MAKVMFAIMALIFLCQSAIAETIDVNIKGVDDGIKTSKQQDYKEAVMLLIFSYNMTLLNLNPKESFCPDFK
jgi:hypothetical protein